MAMALWESLLSTRPSNLWGGQMPNKTIYLAGDPPKRLRTDPKQSIDKICKIPISASIP